MEKVENNDVTILKKQQRRHIICTLYYCRPRQNPVGLNAVEVNDVDMIPCRPYYVCGLDLNL